MENGTWANGSTGGYEYWIKHYTEGSQYGIGEGRISKMAIRKNGKEIYNYDRGLDFDNLDSEGKAVYNSLLKKYN